MQLLERFRKKIEIMNINEVLSHKISKLMWTEKIIIKEYCPQQL